MKTKTFLALVIFFFSLSIVYGDTRGYLSFEYTSGQTGSDEPPPMFRNAQLGVIFSGEIGKRFFYVAEFRVRGTGVDVDQALVSFAPSELFSLSAGLYLIPFGAYNQSSRPHETLLVKLPLHVEEMYPSRWRDIGILTEGNLGFLFYASYFGNGIVEGEDLSSGQQFEDNNKNKAKGGRVGIVFSEKFAAAVSYYRGKYDENEERSVNLYGVDVTWDVAGFQLFFEFAQASLENPESFSSGEATGYLVQLSFPLGKLQPVASYQRLDYEDRFHGAGFADSFTPGAGILLHKARWSVGVVFIPLPNLLVKIEYDFDQDNIQDLKTKAFSAQVALSF